MNTQTLFEVAGYVFDYRARTLGYGNGYIRRLTPIESDLLLFFCEKQNQLVSRVDILQRVWGREDRFKARSMDVFVTMLRKYISPNSMLSLESIRGKGYIFHVK